MSDALEINFDGLVGPTHNYAGLAQGNLASKRHAGLISNPREAALQGLEKMKASMDAGFPQAVLPPQQRPDMGLLHRLGYRGAPEEVLPRVGSESPELLYAACSAAAMWTANAATITPSRDTLDSRVHVTPANLQSALHRSIESAQTARTLKAILADDRYFAHHPALPATPWFSDEGAANHTRLCAEHGGPGVHLFVHGDPAPDTIAAPQRHRPRQTLRACRALARQHGLSDQQTVFAQQHPAAIDAGVFHNDVICVGNGPVLLYHERAFFDERAVLEALRDRLAARADGQPLISIRVPEEAVSLDAAVASYLFNSQLLSRDDGSMTLVVPGECEADEAVWMTIQSLLLGGNNPISEVVVRDVKQSMRNGGGPACLRLRVVLNDAERQAMSGRVMLDDDLYRDLTDWVGRHYRDRLTLDDLADPQLAHESLTALDELTGLLTLGSIYPFQMEGPAG
ncbi:N-succinylarginine dihydrolase [Kushneria pakistanensis]|uniref:N-succinylarginine dihydrolase n=1 Tax=Kushneria pakistanensis TaxID=1508770 RepID=A0ABQ3F920_9GAMM|nr:N-succinylarginine dihydrolase [Kushneria pakistanensis]GHC14590.1 N-succinylarginine dihydrolase [Kushneria pakistanensis]